MLTTSPSYPFRKTPLMSLLRVGKIIKIRERRIMTQKSSEDLILSSDKHCLTINIVSFLIQQTQVEKSEK